MSRTNRQMVYLWVFPRVMMRGGMLQESAKSLAGLMESLVIFAAFSCRASRFRGLLCLTSRLSQLQSKVSKGQTIPTCKYNFIPPLETSKYEFADPEKENVTNICFLALLLQQNPETYEGARPEDVGYADVAAYHLAHQDFSYKLSCT
ncbi:hypothetical protein Tco_0988910 [Tanacetum coccineum]|uniref:Uncharacterized protein n=1 Tax=Tanacetum coccineum TaxID=301880 RepID=A0ABQ5ES79_9ASTR